MRARALVPPLLCATLALAGPAGADDSDANRRAEARDLAHKGDTAFSGGRCDRAIPLWKDAESKFHAPTILLRIARCEALLGKVVDATATFQTIVGEKLATDAPPSWAEAKESASQELLAVKARVASLRIAVDQRDGGGDVKVELDDARVRANEDMAIDPGAHHVRVRTKDTAWEEPVTIAEGEKRTVAVAVVRELPPPPKSAQRVIGYVLGGAGLTAIGVGALFFGWPALNRSGNLDSQCGPDRSQCPAGSSGDISHLKTQALIADVWAGAGAALFVGGAILVLTAPSAKREGPKFRVMPALSPTLGGLRMMGTF